MCFVAPNAYPTLSGREDLTNDGGAERQQVLLARELMRRGHAVSFVVLDHGQPDDEEVRGIRVFKCYRRERGVRVLRFFHPRLTGLSHAMRRANADVYYQRCGDSTTGLVGQWCRRHKREFVFATAHDADCTARLPLISRPHERLLYRYGLRHASAVVAQTAYQQEMLRAEFGVESTVVPNCFVWRWGSESPGVACSNGTQEPQDILWVGRLSAEKRPEWVLELARALPGCRFHMVGQCDTAYGREVVAKAEALPNVQYHGHVPHQNMVELYRKCRLLLCSSWGEGFPNVFLEAWSCGRGVLSTVDPDDVIARSQIGVVATSLEEMKRQLVALEERSAFWVGAGARGRDYVRTHHGVAAAGQALAEVINGTLTRPQGRKPRVAISIATPEVHPNGTASAVALRRMPYPYRAMLAISSDLDETPNADVYRESMRFLNTTETTAMGPGVGLEVANSIYFDMPPDQFAYWNTDDAGRAMVRAMMRSGHIDTIHSFGDLATTRAHAQRALDELARHGCRPEIWIDHAVAPTNFGPDIMQGQGDVSGAPAYHADLSHAFGIRYVWVGRVTSVIGQEVPPSLGGLVKVGHPIASLRTVAKEAAKGFLARAGSPKYRMHAENTLLRRATLRSGHEVFEFLRSNPCWRGVDRGETADGLAEVLIPSLLGRLVQRAGVCILYTHLGKVRRAEEPFGPKTREALRLLAGEHQAGRILVTTTRRALGYCRAAREIDYTIVPEGAAIRIDVSTRASSDLAGLTFYVTDPGRTRITVDGRQVAEIVRNQPDETGRRSVSLPWPALEFPRT